MLNGLVDFAGASPRDCSKESQFDAGDELATISFTPYRIYILTIRNYVGHGICFGIHPTDRFFSTAVAMIFLPTEEGKGDKSNY